MADTSSANHPGDWHLKTPEGVIFGPVSWEQLESWVRQGRVDESCRLRLDDQDWQPAANLFPVLAQILQSPPEGENPFLSPATNQPPDNDGATASDADNQPPTPTRVAPHRGHLVLAMAILGWLLCPAFAMAAWVMASADLAKIRKGEMDPDGLAYTQASRVLSLLALAALMLLVMTGLVMLLAMTAAGRLNWIFDY